MHKDAEQLPRTRSRLRAADAEDILRQYEASGLKLQQYCRDNGLTYKTIEAWKRKLRPRAARADFVAVEVKESVAAPCPNAPTEEPCVSSIEVRLRSNRAIWVARGFDRQLLKALVETLEEMPC